MPSSNIKITKVVVSMGIGAASQDKKLIEPASRDLTVITGQKPKVTRARRAIAEFKLRAGAPIGLVVTLRGRRMEAFLTKLFRIVLPRLRDFRGVPTKGFDGHGNYNLGLAEQVVFSEIDSSQVRQTRGLQVTIVTDTNSDQAARDYLKKMGKPFEKEALSAKATGGHHG